MRWTPSSISAFSFKYMFPKIPDTTTHMNAMIHSHAKSNAIVRYCEKKPTMAKMSAVTAAKDPTATAKLHFESLYPPTYEHISKDV